MTYSATAAVNKDHFAAPSDAELEQAKKRVQRDKKAMHFEVAKHHFGIGAAVAKKGTQEHLNNLTGYHGVSQQYNPHHGNGHHPASSSLDYNSRRVAMDRHFGIEKEAKEKHPSDADKRKHHIATKHLELGRFHAKKAGVSDGLS